MNLDNLTPTETLFRRAVEAAGIPTTDAEYRAEWQRLADEANVQIANPSKYSAFWAFVTAAMIAPARWLVAFMVRHVMPNVYVLTASGEYLDILAWAHDLKRKPSTRARGWIVFTRNNPAQQLLIPKGTSVRTIPINGNIYRMRVISEAVMEIGELELPVLCEAERDGAGYNLGAGYYGWIDSDVPGITGVTNRSDWLDAPGVDVESDDQLRLRIRYQFAAAGDWHTDAKYRSMIAAQTGFRPDRIFFKGYDAQSYLCRGPGSADAFILFDAGTVPLGLLVEINHYINQQGNHGHGDDLKVFALPESIHNVAVEVKFRRSTPLARRADLLVEIENVIRCAFRQNSDYQDKVSQTWPYARFAFSQLDFELHGLWFEIEALVWGQEDIISQLDVPRLGNLSVTEVAE